MRVMPFEISVCGIVELDGFRGRRVSHVLSILDPDHPVPDAFGHWDEHARLELRFHDIVDELPGMIPPSTADVARILDFGRELGEVAHLLVHCHAGVSRSTAALTLLLAQARPDPEAALDEVVRIRPRAWPNLRMLEHGDELLGLGGTLVDAVRGHYRRVAARDPDFVRMIAQAGRAREVPEDFPA
jgi:predicted protein tyrosine phosphatase